MLLEPFISVSAQTVLETYTYDVNRDPHCWPPPPNIAPPHRDVATIPLLPTPPSLPISPRFNDRSFSNFLINFNSNFWKIIIMFQVYESLSQWNYWKPKIWILDSLLRQWNGFEDFSFLNFSKISLKFATVFKIFEFFCPFLSLTIVTGQWSFSSLADGLLNITPETKNGF